jgi:hypothetical protein
MITGQTFREEAEAAGWRVVRAVPLFRGLHAQHIALLEPRRSQPPDRLAGEKRS